MNKKIGWLCLIIALLFINIIPDPTDVLTLPIYSAFTGADISPNNLSVVYLDFLGWSFLVGLCFLLSGMYLLNWNFKRLWKKINPGKYSIALSLSVVTVIFVALFDVWSMNSGVFGSAIDYMFGNYTDGWWNLFFKFVMSFLMIVPLAYYFLVRKDKSEALGIALFSIILFWGGLSDLFFFIFLGQTIPLELPWLMGSPFISFISTNLGFATVTNISLIISVIISFILAWLVAKVLKEKF